MRSSLLWTGLSVIALSATEPVWAAPPEPVPPPPRERPTEAKVELGPEFGVVYRPADDSNGIEYRPAFAWGVHARVEFSSWLGIRPWARHSSHRVALGPRGLASNQDPSLAGVSFTQPNIDVWVLGVQLEPTLRISRGLRLWWGLGFDWGRLEVPQPTCEGSCSIQTSHRTGVFVELTNALGATLDLVSDWLAAVATVQYGVRMQESGTMFGEAQAFSQGQMHHVTGLPPTRVSLTLMLGLGIVR